MDNEGLALGAATFTLGVIVTAVAQSSISRFFDRARPSVRISGVSIGPEESAVKKKCPLDLVVLQEIEANPILGALRGEKTVQELNEYVENSILMLQNHQAVIKHLHDLIQRPHLLDAALNKDRQRIELLKIWNVYGEPLSDFTKLAIHNCLDEIRDIYKQPHPDGWKTGPRTIVGLGPNHNYALFELDEEAYANSVAKEKGPHYRDQALREVRTNNILRRFWIHLDEQDLRWLFTKAHDVAVAVGEDASRITNRLATIIKTTTPDYLRVSAVISNSGQRACAVKPLAYLRLPRVDAISGEDALISLVQETEIAALPSPIVINGNSAAQITFRSEMSLTNLKVLKTDGSLLLDGNRLLTLYNSQILQSFVAVSLTGFGIEQTTLIVSEPIDFGLPALTRDRENLSRALRNG